jgi:hypothetical protein
MQINQQPQISRVDCLATYRQAQLLAGLCSDQLATPIYSDLVSSSVHHQQQLELQVYSDRQVSSEVMLLHLMVVVYLVVLQEVVCSLTMPQVCLEIQMEDHYLTNQIIYLAVNPVCLVRRKIKKMEVVMMVMMIMLEMVVEALLLSNLINKVLEMLLNP